jgi:hypothetical protein
VVPVLYDPQDPSRAHIATLGWPVMDVLLLLLGVVVSALLPVAMLRVWLQGRRRLSARMGRREQPAQQEAKHPRDPAAEVSQGMTTRGAWWLALAARRKKEEWNDDVGQRARERAGDRTSGGGDAA